MRGHAVGVRPGDRAPVAAGSPRAGAGDGGRRAGRPNIGRTVDRPAPREEAGREEHEIASGEMPTPKEQEQPEMSPDPVRGVERFRRERFPDYRERFERLVEEGQSPDTLFIGCSDSRVMPGLLVDASPGDLFVARNVGALVPPFDPDGTEHGTAAAVEYAVGVLEVDHVVVCGHSHCGAVAALYDPPSATAPNLERWLRLAGDARLDLDRAPDADDLRRTERRCVALQLGRLADYPLVRDRMGDGELALHGWHYLIGEGRVEVLDAGSGSFLPAGGG